MYYRFSTAECLRELSSMLRYTYIHCLYVQQPHSGLSRLIVEVSYITHN